MNVKKMGMSLGILSMSALLSTKVFAFGMMEVEDWQFQFSGNVNAFVVSTDCDSNGNGDVAGGLACGSGGENGRDNNVRTGLLPSWFGFRAARNVDESHNKFKTGVTLGFQPGVDDNQLNPALGNALGNNSVNFRQVFFDISKDSFGTIKIGRDLGLFGGDAILSDMTLLGIGTIGVTAGGGNTSLGRIGVGYLYADWKAQAQYTSPDMNGLSFSVALVDPWKVGGLAGANSFSPASQENDNFGYEGKVNYAVDNAKFWAGFIAQEVEASDTVSYDARGFDVGAKFNVDGLELVGYYYTGKGIGTTGFLLDGAAANGERRDSDGFYVQATYKPAKTKFGISYGESSLDLASNEGPSGLVSKNESIIFGIYHSFNDALTLVAEYTNTEAEAHDGNSAEEQSFGIGGIMFF